MGHDKYCIRAFFSGSVIALGQISKFFAETSNPYLAQLWNLKELFILGENLAGNRVLYTVAKMLDVHAER